MKFLKPKWGGKMLVLSGCIIEGNWADKDSCFIKFMNEGTGLFGGYSSAYLVHKSYDEMEAFMESDDKSLVCKFETYQQRE